MTTMGYMLLAVDADDTVISNTLAPLGNGSLHAWLEDPTRIDGFQLRDDVTAAQARGLLRTWTEGRLFTPSADLRWEHQDAGIYIVLIADVVLPEAFEGQVGLTPIAAWTSASEEIDSPDSKPEPLLLWGETRAEGWHEDRIPKLERRIPTTWKGRYAAVLTRMYEADEPVHGAEDGPRLVTRYLEYDTAYNPLIDGRFTDNRSQTP